MGDSDPYSVEQFVRDFLEAAIEEGIVDERRTFNQRNYPLYVQNRSSGDLVRLANMLADYAHSMEAMTDDTEEKAVSVCPRCGGSGKDRLAPMRWINVIHYSHVWRVTLYEFQSFNQGILSEETTFYTTLVITQLPHASEAHQKAAEALHKDPDKFLAKEIVYLGEAPQYLYT